MRNAAPSRSSDRAMAPRQVLTARCTVRRCFALKRPGAASIRRMRMDLAPPVGSPMDRAPFSSRQPVLRPGCEPIEIDRDGLADTRFQAAAVDPAAEFLLCRPDL